MTDKPMTPERRSTIEAHLEQHGMVPEEYAQELLAEIDRRGAALEKAEAKCVEYGNKWRNAEQNFKHAERQRDEALAALEKAEAERDDFKLSYRQAADAVIAQSKRAEQCYAAGIETGVAIGEQNKRDALKDQTP